MNSVATKGFRQPKKRTKRQIEEAKSAADSVLKMTRKEISYVNSSTTNRVIDLKDRYRAFVHRPSKANLAHLVSAVGDVRFEMAWRVK